MASYGEAEVRFNLLAVIPDQIQLCTQRLGQISAAKESIQRNIAGKKNSQKRERKDVDPDKVDNVSELMDLDFIKDKAVKVGPKPTSSQLSRALTVVKQNETEIQRALDEEVKHRENLDIEIQRRSFNYGPFIRRYIEILVKKNGLQQIIDKENQPPKRRKK
ncbi:hypothetical protein HK102_002226 [Quaeritorhiza haematococci]|nr:hypothetical protein HK102_002226 [Quaeritorhiza haematococci]